MSIQPALWRCFVHEGGKLENRQFVAQNAPDCTNLRLKFQNFPGGNTPGLPMMWRGTPPPQIPFPRLAEFVQL